MTSVRVLTAKDAERASELHRKAFPQNDVWTPRAFQSLLEQESSLGIAHVGDDQFISLALFRIALETADLLTFAVAPSKQRQGWAAALLNASQPLLSARNVTRITLEVAQNNSAAISFYERMGFVEDGWRVNYYKHGDGTHRDAILMSRGVVADPA
ncbi:MAG: ribosomal protein S18-alanine N-acetyltransferase [Pseudomonadota bacterium]